MIQTFENVTLYVAKVKPPKKEGGDSVILLSDTPCAPTEIDGAIFKNTGDAKCWAFLDPSTMDKAEKLQNGAVKLLCTYTVNPNNVDAETGRAYLPKGYVAGKAK